MTMAIFFNYNTYNYNSNYNISFNDNNTSITTQFHLMTTSLFSNYNQHNYNSNYNIFQWPWHQHSVHNTHIHILHYHICQWPQHFNYNLIFITIFITINMLGVYRYAPCCNWYVVNDMWHLHSAKLQFTNTMFKLMIALCDWPSPCCNWQLLYDMTML